VSQPVNPEDRCFNCDEKGHFQRDCPLLNNPTKVTTPTVENSSSLHSLNEIQWSDPLTTEYDYRENTEDIEAMHNLKEAMHHLNSTRGATN
jgi:hypothetical protein